jgi:hypothetical protein
VLFDAFLVTFDVILLKSNNVRDNQLQSSHIGELFMVFCDPRAALCSPRGIGDTGDLVENIVDNKCCLYVLYCAAFLRGCRGRTDELSGGSYFHSRLVDRWPC